MKAKVFSGTSGVSQGLAVYELNLMVALRLQEELENSGYTVKHRDKELREENSGSATGNFTCGMTRAVLVKKVI